MSTGPALVIQGFARESKAVYLDVYKNPESSLEQVSRRTGINEPLVDFILRSYSDSDDGGMMKCHLAEVNGGKTFLYSIIGEYEKIPLKNIAHEFVDQHGNESEIIIDEGWIPKRTNNGYMAKLKKLLKV